MEIMLLGNLFLCMGSAALEVPSGNPLGALGGHFPSDASLGYRGHLRME